MKRGKALLLLLAMVSNFVMLMIMKGKQPAIDGDIQYRGLEDAYHPFAKDPYVHICRVPRFHVGHGIEKNVTFQCSGKAYEEFGQRLLELHKNSTSITWGNRLTPFPADRAILFYGNSHTRQLVESFLCQYRGLIVEGALVPPNHNMGYVRFLNNSTVHWVINSWTAFSPHWCNDLIDNLPYPRSLASFDAVIMGQFNQVRGKSKYVDEMKRESQHHPTMNISRTPPTLKDLAKCLTHESSRIIGVPMFNRQGVWRYKENLLHAQEIDNSVHMVEVIDPRKYIPNLKECGAASQFEINECKNTRPASIQAHKCAGPAGGFADAVNWDLIEILHKVLTIA